MLYNSSVLPIYNCQKYLNHLFNLFFVSLFSKSILFIHDYLYFSIYLSNSPTNFLIFACFLELPVLTTLVICKTLMKMSVLIWNMRIFIAIILLFCTMTPINWLFFCNISFEPSSYEFVFLNSYVCLSVIVAI